MALKACFYDKTLDNLYYTMLDSDDGVPCPHAEWDSRGTRWAE